MTPYYEDDLVTLYHADSLAHPQLWTGADVLITDPPCGIKWRGYDRLQSIVGDSTPETRDAALDLWGADRPAAVFGSWSVGRPSAVRHRLIWWKRGMAPGSTRSPFMIQDEEIYILGSGWISTSPPMRSVIVTDESRAAEVRRIGHPTPKPIGLMETLISRAPDGVIADPFAGSGSTLVAAKLAGRRAIGVEIDEDYCRIAVSRLAQDALFGGEAA